MNEAVMRDAGAIPPLEFFCDFLREDDVADGGAFDFTAISSGTFAVSSAAGGKVRVSGAATTDDSGGQIQAKAGFICSGLPISFKAKHQLGESTSSNGATESEWYLGLLPVDTSIVASFPIDGIYFGKADGGTTLKCEVRTNNATPVFTVTLPASVYTEAKAEHRYGITVFPNGSDSQVEFTIDGVVVARATGISLPASTVYLTPSYAMQSGDNTGTKYADLDYVGTYQQRTS